LRRKTRILAKTKSHSPPGYEHLFFDHGKQVSSSVLGQFAINAWEVVSPKTLMETGKLNMDKGVDMPAEDGRFKSASILK
jgi:hypothetical protein